jgi:hypothetical protein
MPVLISETTAELGRRNLAFFLTFESYGCFVFTLMHFVAAGWLYESESTRVVYGDELVDLGGFMLFMGFAAILYGLASLYVARTHNRAIAIAVMVLMAATLAGEVAVAVTIKQRIEPDFDYEVQADCLAQLPSEENEDTVCPSYFESNRTIALWRLWQLWLAYALEEEQTLTGGTGPYKDTLLLLQSSSRCCGFSRPQMCRVNRTLAPATTDFYKEGQVAAPGDCGAYYASPGTYQLVEQWCVPALV